MIGRNLKRKWRVKKSPVLSIGKCNMRRQIHLFPEEMTRWNEINWCEEFAWEGFLVVFFKVLIISN